MKHLTILVLMFSTIFSSELIFAQQNADISKQEVIELRKELDKLQLKNEKLDSEIQQLKVDNAKTVGKAESFDSNLDSYNNHFGSILQYFFWTVGIMIALLGLISWQFIFKSISKVEETLSNEIEKIIDDRKKIAEALWNSHRAQYDTHKYNKSYEFAALFATRCMIYFTQNNDEKGELQWLNNTLDCIKNVSGKLKKKRVQNEIIGSLSRVTSHSESKFYENILVAEETISLINNKTDLEDFSREYIS